MVIAQADQTSSFVGSFASGLTRTLLLQAVEALDDNDVPDDGQRWGLLTPRQWSIALTIAEFASADFVGDDLPYMQRSEEHTSELQSLMRISYAVFCLNKKKDNTVNNIHKSKTI